MATTSLPAAVLAERCNVKQLHRFARGGPSTMMRARTMLPASRQDVRLARSSLPPLLWLLSVLLCASPSRADDGAGRQSTVAPASGRRGVAPRHSDPPPAGSLGTARCLAATSTRSGSSSSPSASAGSSARPSLGLGRIARSAGAAAQPARSAAAGDTSSRLAEDPESRAISGAPPWYRSWWFWSLIGAAAIITAGITVAVVASSSDDVKQPPALLPGFDLELRVSR